MHAITIIFPHQLFDAHPAVSKNRTVYLVEEYLYFKQYSFHKQKLVLHRSSMKAYAAELADNNIEVNYIDANEPIANILSLIPFLKKQGVTDIYYTHTVDYWLEKRITESAKSLQLNLHPSTSPNFLNTTDDLNRYFDQKKKYFQTDFYIAQRKQRKILIEKDNKPTGGKWTFDKENRQKFPKKESIPELPDFGTNKFISEAINYVNKNFTNNYGEINTFNYPITRSDAVLWLNDFLENRLSKFGTYEDAMVQNENTLYHSILTPILNIGLINPQIVLDEVLKVAGRKNIPLNSLEGFIRQIIGWREFIRILYEREGRQQRTKNYWGFSREIPTSFWQGTTGILPVDTVIKRLLQTGYSHHIERLMVLGNFMLLCEFDPNEVYRWFMKMYIDSYDWVMVPNVYGMSQFADGGLMTTKPYISGSNYLLKMGNWEKGEWQKTWDGLFWRFMHTHRTFFMTNPRLGMLIRSFDKMPEEKRDTHLKIANEFLKKIDLEN